MLKQTNQKRYVVIKCQQIRSKSSLSPCLIVKHVLLGSDSRIWRPVHWSGWRVRLLRHPVHQGAEGGGDRDSGDQPQHCHGPDQQGAGRQGLSAACDS